MALSLPIMTDLDECHLNNGGCNQTCMNGYGSFECSCGTGYSLASNSLDCEGGFMESILSSK